MAKSVIPEFIGRVRGAERNVRYVPTNEGKALQEVGKAISDAGKTALKGLGVMAELADERYRAEYSKALMEAEAEAGRRFDEEVKQRVGFDAVGAAQRAQQIYAEVGAKYRPSIAERYQDKFDLAWGKHSNGQFRVATDFEFRNVRQANLDAETAIMTGARDRAAAAMDPEAQIEAWDEMTEAYNRRFKIINGRLITPESLQKFDADVNDGNNVVTIGGKKLTIVDDGNEAKEGTISRSRIKEIRAAMETQAKAYEKGLTDQYDLSHANIIDGLLKADRIEEAREHLEELKQRTVPASDKAISKFEEALRRHEEVRLIKTSADKYVADAVEAAVKKGGSALYGSPEQDAEFYRAVASEKDPKKRAYAIQLYRAKRQEQATRLQLDRINFIKENLQTKDPQTGKAVPLPLHKQEEAIKKMEEGPLKDEMVKQYKAMKTAFENEQNASLEYQMYADESLRRVTADITNGFYTDKEGDRVALDSNEKTAEYIRSFGFTSKYKNLVLGIVKDSRNAVSEQEVRDLFGKAGMQIPADSWWVGFTMRQLEDARGGRPFGNQSERAKWMKEAFNELLKLEMARNTPFPLSDYFDNETIREHIRDNPEGDASWALKESQLEELNAFKVRMGSPQASRRFGDKAAVALFLRQRGNVFKGNNLFLNPKKRDALKNRDQKQDARIGDLNEAERQMFTEL